MADSIDPFRDPTFRPCRDERCAIDRLHGEHPRGRGRKYKECPLCKGSLVREGNKHAHCADRLCGWRRPENVSSSSIFTISDDD